MKCESYYDARRNLIAHFDSVSKPSNPADADAVKEESSAECGFNTGCSVPPNNCDPHHVLYNFLSSP
ncbi:hypothetical protein RIF29_01908 [Crotalaria pallida]|uniref:Uncharacterized protein n=1 Tax=Crotalaria pallida TaxID=3830 RepID=A0AAN9IYI7_CROPI